MDPSACVYNTVKVFYNFDLFYVYVRGKRAMGGVKLTKPKSKL